MDSNLSVTEKQLIEEIMGAFATGCKDQLTRVGFDADVNIVADVFKKEPEPAAEQNEPPKSEDPRDATVQDAEIIEPAESFRSGMFEPGDIVALKTDLHVHLCVAELAKDKPFVSVQWMDDMKHICTAIVSESCLEIVTLNGDRE